MIGRTVGLLAVGLSLWSAPAVGAPERPTLVGKEWTYQVRAKDTLGRIAARYHLSQRVIRGLNQLKPGARLKPGQTLRLSTRHVVPPPAKAAVVINIPDLILYRFEDDRLAGWYPVALGQPFDETFDQDHKRWQTPTGTFKVVEKRTNPVWRVPKSIQEEMAAEGKTVYEQMPPGPENPLGKFWIGLSRWGYGIHGTIAPTTVGRYKTHGCIRMKPGHIDQVFDAVQLGSVVRIVYEPIQVAILGQQVWLKVAPDTYDQIPDMGARVQARLADAGVAGRVDPARVAQVTKDQWGIAVRVDRSAPPVVTPSATASPRPSAVPATDQ